MLCYSAIDRLIHYSLFLKVTTSQLCTWRKFHCRPSICLKVCTCCIALRDLMLAYIHRSILAHVQYLMHVKTTVIIWTKYYQSWWLYRHHDYPMMLSYYRNFKIMKILKEQVLCANVFSSFRPVARSTMYVDVPSLEHNFIKSCFSEPFTHSIIL